MNDRKYNVYLERQALFDPEGLVKPLSMEQFMSLIKVGMDPSAYKGFWIASRLLSVITFEAKTFRVLLSELEGAPRSSSVYEKMIMRYLQSSGLVLKDGLYTKTVYFLPCVRKVEVSERVSLKL